MNYTLGKYKLKIFPEAFSPSVHFMISKGYISLGGLDDKHLSVIMLNDKGKILDQRPKVVMSKRDMELGYIPGDEFKTFHLGRGKSRLTILPIICYEIKFRDIWQSITEEVNLVTHHIGYNMRDLEQAKRWISLQKEVANFFECDLVCSCGNHEKGINISGIQFSLFSR